MTPFVVFFLLIAFLAIGSVMRQEKGSRSTRDRFRTTTNAAARRIGRRFDAAQGAEQVSGDIASRPSSGSATSGASQWSSTAWTPTPTAGPPIRNERPPAPAQPLQYADWPIEAAPPAPPPPSAAQPATADTSASPPAKPERYVGSAALESTLDSTIESSLLGMPAGPVTTSVMPGGPVIELPRAVETRVLAMLRDGQEVAAVRLVCDEMDCGLLDAMRTVQKLSGRPR